MRPSSPNKFLHLTRSDGSGSRRGSFCDGVLAWLNSRVRELLNITKTLHLLCLLALLTPLIASAQVGYIAEYDWSIHIANAQYGVVEVTNWGPHGTYTYLCFCKAEYRVHASAQSLAAIVLVPLLGISLLVMRRGRQRG